MYFIEVGLDRLVDLIVNEKIESIAIPPLGCGNGGLEWNSVKQVIVSKLVLVELLTNLKIGRKTRQNVFQKNIY
jgi:O-acetyl-ADP-ribose deacetylase (regulator of RNase III)